MLTERQWRTARIVLLIGVAAGIGGLVTGYLLAPQRFFPAYLLAFLFWSGISLGCLAWLLLHNAGAGQWGFALQRVLEGGARTMPLMALLFIPLLFGFSQLYPWATSQSGNGDVLFLTQGSYLNLPFFIVRAVVYFAVWIALALVVTRWSYRSDNEPEPGLDVWQNRVRISAVGLLLFVFTANFAAIDWLMSLEPQWYSSVFGWLAVARHALGGLALVILLLGLLRETGRATALHDVLTGQALNDMGAVFLAALLSWAYLALMQFLVIWTADIPREVVYYLRRSEGNWLWVLLALVVAYVALPTLLLLLRPVKRRLRFLAAVAALVFLLHFVHLYWLVMPIFDATFSVHWLDLVLPVGMGLLWLALAVWQILRHPLLPANNPMLQDDLSQGARRTVV